MNYYYSIDGTDVAGPYSVTELAQFFATGSLPASAQVCAEGQQAWQPLCAIIKTGLRGKPQNTSSAAKVQATPPPPLPPKPAAAQQVHSTRLRDCPSCGNQVSTEAVSCPKCGHLFKSAGGINPNDPVHIIGLVIAGIIILNVVLYAIRTLF